MSRMLRLRVNVSSRAGEAPAGRSAVEGSLPTEPTFVSAGGPSTVLRCSAAPAARDDTGNYDIQFTPASLFHFVVIFFDLVQNSIEPRPVMSPTPNFDSFQPPKPNGSRGTGTPTFTPTIPALAFSIT